MSAPRAATTRAGEEDGIQRRAAIFIGPEFGTVSRPDLVTAAREAADGAFDVLIACAFNYEAHTTEFERLGSVPVLKARMNADLHMAADLKNTGKGNLFVIFGEPDISVASGQWLVANNGSKVANYEHVKELSGLASLEEINRVGKDGLLTLCSISAGGKVRHDQSDPAGSGVGSGEHRGGSERHGTREFLQFLGVASGSLAETETFLILAQELEMVTPEQTKPLLSKRRRLDGCSTDSNARCAPETE